MKGAFLFLALLALPAIAFSATINVPGDYSKIQAAIDAASTGDLILVDRGTYKENIDFLGKAITVQSVDGSNGTVIDGRIGAGSAHGSVVTFANAEGRDSVLQGFTIINGEGSLLYGGYNGGGIFCRNASPKILANYITDNTVSHEGGGIYCSGVSSPLIQGNLIADNTTTGGEGGGICSRNNSIPEIIGNIIMGNYASDTFEGRGGGINGEAIVNGNMITLNVAFSEGGGIYGRGTITNNFISDNISDRAGGVSGWATSLIAHNTIKNNLAQFKAGGIECSGSDIVLEYNNILQNQAFMGGGGIYCGGGSPTIRYNKISNNTSDQDGGGIDCVDSSPYIQSNYILNNEAVRFGGGINCTGVIPNLGFLTPQIINNTLVGNDAAQGDGLSVGSSPQVENCIFWNGGTSEIKVIDGSPVVLFCNIQGGWPGGTNFDDNPNFVNAATGDYHLKYDSPGKDNGNNLATYLPVEDYEGDPRIADGIVDIGADEFYPHLYHTGNTSPGGSIWGKFVGEPGSYINGLWIGSGVVDPPIPTVYGQLFLLPPLISIRPIGTIPADGVLIVPGTVPLTPPGPYSIPFQAMIEMVLTNLDVLEVQ